MVVPATDFYKALSDPLQAIQDLYVKQGNKQDFSSVVSKHFQSLFQEKDARAKITPLTRSLLKGDSLAESGPSTRTPRLIRWRCMIQDTNMGSELMLRRYKGADGSWKNGLFGATNSEEEENHNESIQAEPDTNGLSSLETLYAVSLPGQSMWSQLEDERLESFLDGDDVLNRLERISFGKDKEEEEVNYIKGKLPTGTEMGLLLKVYDEESAASMRVAQVVDIIGILDHLTLPMGQWSATEDVESNPSLYPAIHVVTMQKVVQDDQQVEQDQAEATREALIEYLAQGLKGDRLAAEWLLLSLIAKIHTRTASHVLGPLSLNISSFPSSSDSTLHKILSNIVPLFVSQSLDLKHLNDKDTTFSPKSQADEAGLQAGCLQVADGTLLLLDENTMQEGQLNEKGMENIKTLSTLLTSRKLTYTFPYNNLEMDTDVNCVILSQGKSFLPFDVQIALQPQQQEEAQSDTNGKRITSSSSRIYSLHDFRNYLSTMQSRCCQAKLFSIDSTISDRIQNDFVESRSAKRASSCLESQEDLGRIIHVARLLCLSRGNVQLSWNDWEDAKSLDAQRLLRLQTKA